MINVISLGAGVQSSTMALMAMHGEITPFPDAAIFADTQNEPKAVMEWLDWIENKLTFPVYRVTTGNLAEDFLKAVRGESNRCGQPPYFVRNPDNDNTAARVSGGMLWRQCTKDYKLNPIRRKVRELSSGKHVNQWIGITIDEAHRMKTSGVKYITNTYPLIDLGMSRNDCLIWMEKHGFPKPSKSACWHCPYSSDSRFREFKLSGNGEWSKLVQFDHALREKRVNKLSAGIKGEIFVHRSMKPIDEVDLRNAEDMGQLNMFGNECEGMCGV